jgi:ABC-type sugar transport system substrate-binding protein
VYVAIDPKTVTGVLGQAVDAGIPVICYLTCVETIKNSVVIGFNPYKLGYDLGGWIAKQLKAGQKKLGGRPVLVTIDQNNTQPILTQLQKGRNAAIKAAGVHPRYFTSPPTLADPAKGLEYAANMLTAHPRIDVLDCNVDSVGLACIKAMKAANRTIPMAAGNGDCLNLRALLNGEQAYDTILFLDAGGATAVNNASQIVAGRPAKNSDVRTQGLDRATALAILSGKRKAPPGLNTLARLREARAGCK